MSNLRKNLHLAYKEKLVDIILEFTHDVSEDSVVDTLENFEALKKYTVDWVNAHWLPMGDFDKEQAIKEIEGWSE